MAPLLIDVRTKEEYDEQHASSALHIPVDEICDEKLGVLSSISKDTPLRVYCRSGGRSERACFALTAFGYTDVVNIGGLEDAQALV
jgi:phage shock protein E